MSRMVADPRGRRADARIWWRRAAASLAFSTAALATVACLSPNPTGSSDAEFLRSLLGGWNWESATGGIAGTTRTPDSEGFTMRLTLDAQGRIEVFRNDSLLVSTTYEFVPSRSPGNDVQTPKLVYQDLVLGFDQHTVGRSGDRLRLEDPCCDGFIYLWRPR